MSKELSWTIGLAQGFLLGLIVVTVGTKSWIFGVVCVVVYFAISFKYIRERKKEGWD